MSTFTQRRERMVEQQIAARGVTDAHVLEAMRTVPREHFVSGRLHEFAYDDSPLPIEEAQTISQPYMVALMIEAAGVEPGDRVLEVGAGSGYASAVISRIAREVYAVEWHAALAALAQQRLAALGYSNARITQGDGTLGWREHAPFDAIIVSAGGPEVPESLLAQLAIGGCLVIPVGHEPRTQVLLRIRRTGEHEYEREDLGQVQFVPLVGSEGWSMDGSAVPERRAPKPLRVRGACESRLGSLIARNGEAIDSIDEVDLAPLLDRIGDARVVLLGEATHGTSEFYRMRARITRELIETRGFTIVAIEGDWPDTAAIDRAVRRRSERTASVPGRSPASRRSAGRDSAGPTDAPARPRLRLRERPFSRFPTWMWRNREMREFIDWLTARNASQSDPAGQASIHGLDVYSLNNSIGAVLDYLEQVDPAAAESARTRYGCFSPWECDPATYGRAAAAGRLAGCEHEAVSILTDLLARRMEYLANDGEAFFDATRNAAVVREAERYYRVMYYGSRESWNLRDRHMFDTLQAVLAHRGPESRAVVWAHNSHVGDAAATEMGARGEISIGQLARREYGAAAYAIGFGTDHGTVAAASNWGDPMQVMSVRPSHRDSYEHLCHQSGVRAFLLPLRLPRRSEVRSELLAPHLERAIGVIYRPETEILSHYYQAVLPAQFDEYVWFDATRAIEPLPAHEVVGSADAYPFGS